MGTTFADMAFKTWTPEELLDLVKLAERKGVKKKKLAEDYIGCDESYLSHLLKGRKVPSDMARGALTNAENRVKKMKDKATNEQA